MAGDRWAVPGKLAQRGLQGRCTEARPLQAPPQIANEMPRPWASAPSPARRGVDRPGCTGRALDALEVCSTLPPSLGQHRPSGRGHTLPGRRGDLTRETEGGAGQLRPGVGQPTPGRRAPSWLHVEGEGQGPGGPGTEGGTAGAGGLPRRPVTCLRAAAAGPRPLRGCPRIHQPSPPDGTRHWAWRAGHWLVSG